MADIKQVAHVVLGVRDIERSIEFYTEVLGMELVKTLDQPEMAFLSFGERDHDIGVMKVPDGLPVGSSAMAHTALQIAGGRQELARGHVSADRERRRGGVHRRPRVRGSAYVLDPDGNRLEMFCQEMNDADAKDYLHDAAGAADVFRLIELESL